MNLYSKVVVPLPTTGASKSSSKLVANIGTSYKSSNQSVYSTASPKPFDNTVNAVNMINGKTMGRTFFSTNLRRFFSNRPYRVQNSRTNWGNNPLFQGQNFLYAIIGLNLTVYGAWQYAEEDRR
jgi:hypothetical protein